MSKKKLNKKEIRVWFDELRKNYQAMPDKDRVRFHTCTKEEAESIRIMAYKFII